MVIHREIEDEVKIGPPQEDVSDRVLWLDLPKLVAEGKFALDSLGRDVYSLEERIAVWHWATELHEQNREAPRYPNLSRYYLSDYGIHLVGGDMGEGKTSFCAEVALEFYINGWNVFSTAGLLSS